MKRKLFCPVGGYLKHQEWAYPTIGWRTWCQVGHPTQVPQKPCNCVPSRYCQQESKYCCESCEGGNDGWVLINYTSVQVRHLLWVQWIYCNNIRHYGLYGQGLSPSLFFSSFNSHGLLLNSFKYRGPLIEDFTTRMYK